MPKPVQELLLPLDVQLLPTVSLHAGPLTCTYEHGKLRYLRSGNTEILRMIYIAVRDSNWQTLPYKIDNEKITSDSNSFSIQYNASYYYQSIAVYKSTVNISGQDDGTIRFSFAGEALTSFKRNRLGICLHQPIKECSGQAVSITHTNGSKSEAVFPVSISPHQPFIDMQQMSWQTPDKHQVQLSFEGDIFESEDQRNWSDSSFKTYSTPLTIPLPVTIMPGDKVSQSITCTVKLPGQSSTITNTSYREEKIPFPAIGYSRHTDAPALNQQLIDSIKKLPLHHYRHHIFLQKENWQQQLTDACKDAIALHTKLQLTVTFSDEYKTELKGLVPALVENKNALSTLLPIKLSANFIPAAMQEEIYKTIKDHLPALPVGYGTDGNFVNINRNRPQAGSFDFVNFGLYPQAHSKDERSILENLDNQPDMVAAAAAIANGKPVFVSPVTLHDRTRAADERQHNAFGSWWTLMSLQQLSMASCITLGHLLHEEGFIQLKTDSNNKDITEPEIYSHQLLSTIQSFFPTVIIKRFAGETLLMDGILLENAKGEQLLIKAPDAIRDYRS